MPKKRKTKPKKNLKQLKRIETKLNKILKIEKRQLDEQEDLEKLTKKSDKQFEKEIDDLEKQLQVKVGTHPLKKITTQDLGKALIGSFIGITSHYAFLEGAHFAEKLTLPRAILLLVVAYLIGYIFIYIAGFRKIKQIKIFGLIPTRITVIFIVSLAVIFFVLFIFGLTEHVTNEVLFKQVSAVSIPAIIGAAAADLIGKNE